MLLDLPPAEVAAVLATTLGVAAAVPQARRVVVASDGRGVSLSGALLGVVNEAVWVAYTVHGALWAAAPEAVLMAVANVVLVVWLVRAGAGGWGRAAVAATWGMILVESALWGGYGLHHGDPATTTLAVVGTAGAVAMLARKAVVGLCPRSVDGCLVSTP